ncbi:MAG TPA: DUF6797 domain-containing protein, partial [Verrucomicrobiae bacterium]|nr:DUF6797 domain-containing protein [Verrucomicrobiae bacterium]
MTRLALSCLLFLLPLIFLQAAESRARSPGEPMISGSDPGVQQERDWVDNRWAESDLGPFLASSFRLPDGTIIKALSIRLGTNSEAAVVYDLASMNLRAGWEGGFLRPNASRFGLINPPAIAGKLQFLNRSGTVWSGDGVHLSGLRLQGANVLLEYKVSNATVVETPRWLPGDGGRFVRTLQIGPHPDLRLRVASGLETKRVKEGFVLKPKDGSRTVFVKAEGHGELIVDDSNGDVLLRLGATTETQQSSIIVARDEGAAPGAETAPLEPVDFQALAQPGAARWLPELITKGSVGLNTGPLVVDTLTAPYVNPWKALLFFGGVDFTRNGTAYVCTIHGDVWRVSGIDSSLRALKWKRFATGLYQPLGLRVREDRIFVLGRDRITQLEDENGDGEADHYINFFDGIQTSSSGHDYVTSLEKDDRGNLYYVDPKGFHQVERDGTSQRTLATGFRNPNGAGVSSDGKVLTVAPQQGEWTPSSMIAEIHTGGYYGYGGPKIGGGRPRGYDAPLCWLPHQIDNSSGSQFWIPAGKWDFLSEQMLHLIWGRCGLMLVLRDTNNLVHQGAGFVLPVKFLSGPNRAAWNDLDDALYVAGSTGWQTSAVKDGALQRVRWTGKGANWPVGWRVRPEGIELRFSKALQRDLA